MDSNELCWSKGNYTDECDCEFCSHKHECGRFDGCDYIDFLAANAPTVIEADKENGND